MSAAQLLREAREAGLQLRVSAEGKLVIRGGADNVLSFKPRLAARRAEIVEELIAETDRLMNWWAHPVEGWPTTLTIRNIVRDEVAIIDLRRTEPHGHA